MNPTKNDGGPAFPQQVWDSSASGPYPLTDAGNCKPGMSLRDWFAGQALRVPNIFETSEHPSSENAARYAYSVADAMLAERSKL